MAKRRVVCDYAGNELFPGDLVNYSARTGNRVRVTDAIIERVTTRRVGGRVDPMLKVRPTGHESGFVRRRSYRAEWVYTAPVRLLPPAFEPDWPRPTQRGPVPRRAA